MPKLDSATALVAATQQLGSYSNSPRLDAELLLTMVLNCSRGQLLAYPERLLQPEQSLQFTQLIAQRQAGIPIAYLLGTKEFWSLNLEVTPAVLIPRPETELLVELALKLLPATNALTLADLGTGSGAIALALAHERPCWQLWATDHSVAALTVAERNAQRLGLSNIRFQAGDWCAALPQQRFDAIISNPPYLAVDDPHLNQDGLNYEPFGALTAANNGLADFQTIIASASQYLQKKAWLFLEHGYQQASDIAKLLAQAGFIHIKLYHDLAGCPRVTIAQQA